MSHPLPVNSCLLLAGAGGTEQAWYRVPPAHTCCQAGSLQVTLGEEAVFLQYLLLLLTDKFRTERTER